jgi:hypothetical protein
MGSILLIFHYHVDSLTYDFQWKRRVGWPMGVYMGYWILIILTG